MAGQYNSSITRVRPVFRQLIHRDTTEWLNVFLGLFSGPQAEQLKGETGKILPTCIQSRRFHDKALKKTYDLENSFEARIAPTQSFLRWLIENPDQMVWSNIKTSQQTTDARKALFAGDRKIQRIALDLLAAKGPEKSAHKWWAFEGFTEVDCLIETDKLLLAIEGKRTEEGPSRSISWYPQRNQVVRNLEVVQAKAAGKPFGVILVDEKGDFRLSEQDVNNSLPHLSPVQRQALTHHFLGTTTWQKICEATGLDYSKLPHTIHEANT